MKRLIILTFLLVTIQPVFTQDWKVYPYKPDGSLLSFPADEGRHPSEPTEWWYTSGHLTGMTTGKHYSYMLSYFYNPASIFDGFRIFSISDDDQGLFHTETQALNYNIMARDSLNIEAKIFYGGTEIWRNKLDAKGHSIPFEYVISAASAGRALTLEYNALKPPLILADSGFFYQGATSYTYYYSQTKNSVTGTITLGDITENVTGFSWIDRQFGTFNPSEGHEYEWFCIQLSNGMDFNVYNLFNPSYEIPDNIRYRLLSAYVSETSQYTTSDFQISRLKYRYMPDSLKCWSQEWRITSPVNDVDILVSTLHPYCEVILPFRFYEGSLNVTGTVNGTAVTGSGFAELLHSYEKPDFTVTDTIRFGDEPSLLTWKLNNPDDGNPLKYDVEYSIDSLKTFVPLASSVADTFTFWNTQSLSEENTVWLKVTGYSADNTLKSTRVTKLRSKDTAINDPEYQENILIYPNPSAGHFFIKGENISKIRIMDIAGRTVFSSLKNLTGQPVDISTLKRGIYFIEITTQNGSVKKKLILR